MILNHSSFSSSSSSSFSMAVNDPKKRGQIVEVTVVNGYGYGLMETQRNGKQDLHVVVDYYGTEYRTPIWICEDGRLNPDFHNYKFQINHIGARHKLRVSVLFSNIDAPKNLVGKGKVHLLDVFFSGKTEWSCPLTIDNKHVGYIRLCLRRWNIQDPEPPPYIPLPCGHGCTCPRPSLDQ